MCNHVHLAFICGRQALVVRVGGWQQQVRNCDDQKTRQGGIRLSFYSLSQHSLWRGK